MPGEQKGIKVLHVDDESNFLALTKRHLEQEGHFSVDTSTSAEEGIALLKEGEYDVVVADYQMPVMDGLKFLQKLRASGNTIPFIMLTGKGREDVAMKALNNGANHYLQKGKDIESLFETLSHVIKEEVRKKRAEDALQESEERYMALFDRSLDCVYIHDFEGNFIDANPAALRSLGYEKEELTSLNFTALISQDQIPRAMDTLEEIKEYGSQKEVIEYKLKRKNGEYLYVEAEGSVIYRDGKPCAVQGIARDITDRKLAEAALHESEELLIKVFSTAPIGIGLVTMGPGGVGDRRLGWTNEAMMKIFGFAPDEDQYIGQSADVIYASKEEFERVGKIFREKLKKGELAEVDAKLKRKDGSIFDGYITMSFLDPSNPAKGAVATISDITWRKQAEAALRESEQWLATTLRSIGDAMIATDVNGLVTLINPVAEDLTGWDEAEAVGKPLEDVFNIINAQTGERAENPLDRVLREGVVVGLANHTVLITKDGTIRPIADSGAPIRDENGNIIGTVMVFRDITERKKAEADLKEKQNIIESLIKNSAVATFVIDLEHKLIYWNNACEELTGLKAKEMLGTRDHWKAFYDNPRACVADVIVDKKFNELDKLYKTHARSTLIPDGLHAEGWYPKLGGKNRYVLFDAAPIYNTHGELIAAIETLQDITERKRAEEALQESESKFRMISEQSLVGIVIVQDYVFKYANQALSNILEYSIEEMSNWGPKEYAKIIHPDDLAFVMEQARKKQLGEEDVFTHYEWRAVTKTGKVKWIEIYSKTISYEGKPADFVTMIDITERKQAEDALQESEEKYRTLFETAKDSIFLSDETGKFTDVNQTACDLLGYRKEELLELSNREIDADPRGYEAFLTARDGLTDKIAFEVDQRRKDGTLIPVEITGNFYTSGGQRFALAIARDISDRKQAEEALRESEEKFRSFIDTASDLMLIADKDGNITDVNQSMARILGYSKEELIGMHIAQLLTKEALEKEFKPNWEKFVREGKITLETTLLTKDGKAVLGELKAVAVYNSDGKYAGSRAVFHDLTERKQAEAALRESEEYFRALIENASDGILIVNSEGIITYHSPSIEQILGFKPEEMIGTVISEFIHPEESPEVMKAVGQLIRKEVSTQNLELRAQHKDGSWRTVSGIAQNLLDNPAVGGVVINYRDITERKQAEERLKESEEKWRSLVENAPDGIVVTDVKGTIVQSNTATANMHGYESAEELLGKSFFEFVAKKEHPRIAEQFAEFKKMREKSLKNLEVTGLRKDGSEFPLLFNILGLSDENGKLVSSISVARDITDRKHAEEEIKAALKEKELLLKELHHRVKNNMQVIYSLLNLQSDYIKDEAALALFKESQNRVRSMALIHDRLYRSKDIANIDFAEYTRKLVDDLSSTYGVDPALITLKTDVDAFLGIDIGIPCGLIINELVSNSLKHAFPMGRRGEICITLHLDTEKGKYTLIVRDNGIGFPEDLDFRNTETLGLQLVCGLVDQLEGTIELDRSRGTAFTVAFGGGMK